MMKEVLLQQVLLLKVYVKGLTASVMMYKTGQNV